MKLPNSTQMSQQQKDVYLNAPLTGNILISGAPGTGKTVIAFLRAQSISKQKKKVTVIMFNSVLTSYTSNAANKQFDVKTFHKWFFRWWNGLILNNDGKCEPETYGKKVFLPGCAGFTKEDIQLTFGDVSFCFDRYKKKSTDSSGWVCFDKFKKMWFTNKTSFDSNSLFREYAKPREEPPMVDEYKPDWSKVIKMLVENKDKLTKSQSINWQHLIIDEGQDFSCSMYQVFYMIQEILFKDSKQKPALTVFADENQRIREENSTLMEIERELRLNKESLYKLTYNYRNTREIAELAAEFYVGLKTGIPDFPEKKGDKPRLINCSSYSKSIDYICTYISNHENEEIGIFAQNHAKREKIYNELKKRLSEKIIIQSFKSKQSYKKEDTRDEHEKAENLKFDNGGIVTVVAKASCKGLEFDAVFIPDLQEVAVDPSSIDEFRMEMYVMTSRARSRLFLLLTNQDDSDLQILDYLPQKDKNLMEHINE
jgi:DNA helicase II / ATP-dependent DNA helicase PcrA